MGKIVERNPQWSCSVCFKDCSDQPWQERVSVPQTPKCCARLLGVHFFLISYRRVQMFHSWFLNGEISVWQKWQHVFYRSYFKLLVKSWILKYLDVLRRQDYETALRLQKGWKFSEAAFLWEVLIIFMTSGDTIVKRSCSLLLFWMFEWSACGMLRLYISFPALKLAISSFCCSGEEQTLFVPYVSEVIP